jgi:hypothetical protein
VLLSIGALQCPPQRSTQVPLRREASQLQRLSTVSIFRLACTSHFDSGRTYQYSTLCRHEIIENETSE